MIDYCSAIGWDELTSYTTVWMNLKLCKAKENSHKGAHTVGCHFYEILEKTHLVHSDRKQICSCLCWRRWCWCLEKGMGVAGLSGVRSTFQPLFWGDVNYRLVYNCQNGEQN